MTTPSFRSSVTRCLRDARVKRRLLVLGLAAAALVAPGLTPSGAPRALDARPAIRERTEPVTPRHAEPSRFPEPLTQRQLDVFRGLGAWIDLFDVDLSIDDYVAQMKRNGVQTLYIQTGRTNTDTGVDARVGRWLAVAHRADMKVVGWYLPMYDRPKVDRARTLAIATYRHGPHRFDGLGIDIEFRAAVPGTRWNRRVSRHLATIRRELGPGYPIASIPPPPLQMAVAPGYWSGFPWRALGEHSDAILLMNYWSARRGCPQVRIYCAYEFTAGNIAMTRRLIGRDDRIIHVIGGVGNATDGAEVREFVRGALDAAADGASFYDARTTRAPWWKDLAGLQRLGR